jgi:hypothetical protein
MNAVVFKTDPDHECIICFKSWVEESRTTRRVCENDRCPLVVHATCQAGCKKPDQCCQCKSEMGAWRSKPLLHPASASVDENELYAPAPVPPFSVIMHSSPAYTSCTAVSAAVYLQRASCRARPNEGESRVGVEAHRANAGEAARSTVCAHVPACACVRRHCSCAQGFARRA